MRSRARLWCAIALAAACTWLPALAQSPSPQITGTLGAKPVFGSEDEVRISFSCSGAPTCSGSYQATAKIPECSNILSFAGAFTMTGLNLAAPGSFQGNVSLQNFDAHDQTQPNGTCIIVGSPGNSTFPFTGTWDGTTGTLSMTIINDDSQSVAVPGSFTASSSPPVFPMVVSGSIDANIANIRADIQYRAQDVGSSGSVYTFAVAPQTLVQPALLKNGDTLLPPLGYAKARDGRKDTAVACVLAQLNASGQLQAVSASGLQAFVSGVLGSAGQAVAVINGVATVNIAGATFYVGYGTSAQSMLNNGINRNVVAVPGSLECKPQPPQTGWWWNTAEGGRGYSIEVQGNHIFYAAFLYDDTGRSNWYVATGTTSLDGSLFTGDLLAVANGQTLGGAYRAPTPAQSVGAFTLAFSGASTGTMVWPGGTVAIERFNIVPNGLNALPRANQPETGWWWNPAESGRGFFVEWQDGEADLAGYMYDDAGNPVWYLSVQPTPNIRAFSGNWWLYANGQSLTGAYKPATRINENVAPVTIQFTSATTATMTLPNGRTTSLTRHRF